MAALDNLSTKLGLARPPFFPAKETFNYIHRVLVKLQYESIRFIAKEMMTKITNYNINININL